MSEPPANPPAIPPGSVPTPPRVPTPASSATPSVPTKGWLRRWRRTTQPTPTDFDPVSRGQDQHVSLLDRSPFPIGFFLAIGAMTAFGLVTLIVSLKSVIVLVMLSLALALGLNPVVEWFHHRGIRRGVAVLLVALGVLGALALATWALVPVVSEQVNRLIQQSPTYLVNLRENPQIAAFDAQFQVIDRVVTFLTSG